MAPQQSLAQYYNTVAPIAFGLPTQQATTQAPAPNAFGMAAGGAMSGASIGSMMGGAAGAMNGCSNWWSWWIIRRTIIMNLKEHIPHFVKEHKKAIAVAVVILVIAIII